MASTRVGRQANVQWFGWNGEVVELLRTFLAALLAYWLWPLIIKVWSPFKRSFATIIEQPVLSLIFASCISVAAAEVLSYLIRPLFQDSVLWLLVSMTLMMGIWLPASWSAISVWEHQFRRRKLSFARKSLGYE
jgi:hypothetical protein